MRHALPPRADAPQDRGEILRSHFLTLFNGLALLSALVLAHAGDPFLWAVLPVALLHVLTNLGTALYARGRAHGLLVFHYRPTTPYGTAKRRIIHLLALPALPLCAWKFAAAVHGGKAPLRAAASAVGSLMGIVSPAMLLVCSAAMLFSFRRLVRRGILARDLLCVPAFSLVETVCIEPADADSPAMHEAAARLGADGIAAVCRPSGVREEQLARLSMLPDGRCLARAGAAQALFDSPALLPVLIEEGRSAVAAITRTVELFVKKSLTSLLLLLFTLLTPADYPFTAPQLALVGAFTVALPALVLSFERPRTLAHGHFLRSVFWEAVPGALMGAAFVLLAMASAAALGLTGAARTTLCVYAYALSGLVVLLHICHPFDRLRAVLCLSMGLLLPISLLLFADRLGITLPTLPMLTVLLPLALLGYPLLYLFTGAVAHRKPQQTRGRVLALILGLRKDRKDRKE